ncbi:hypothetical protein [Streptomyces sp. NBC_01546]|uniref:hypothetical protein n=1 Tax=Streptomyces sp. NBC_01546 TaxID=2975872 RepID=UPI0038648C6E
MYSAVPWKRRVTACWYGTVAVPAGQRVLADDGLSGTERAAAVDGLGVAEQGVTFVGSSARRLVGSSARRPTPQRTWYAPESMCLDN